MVTRDDEKNFEEDVSDSDGDSAIMEDASSEPISSSITTNGSTSLSDDELLFTRQKNHYEQLEQIYNEKNRQKLIKFAKTSGLIDIDFRKKIWPLIIHCPKHCSIQFDEKKKIFRLSNDYYAADQNQIESHRFYGQVRLDVERTLRRFPLNYTDAQRLELQEKLILVVMKTLIKQNHLNYYQGYHDICLSFLLVLGTDLCLPLIDTITQSHFKDFMGPTMEKTRDLLSYLMPLINSIDSECAEYLQRGGVGNVMFALSWFITWYSHVLDNFEIILRLYDLFIVSHFLMPVYVAAEIVHYHSEQVLSIDCDMASLHQYLTRLPSDLNLSTWNEIIRRSLNLFRQHHPDTLDFLNDEWKRRCKSIENSPRDFPGEEKFPHENEHQGALPRIVLWGVTLTISGLAIYIWNHAQRTDPTALISLGDFLAQLYRR